MHMANYRRTTKGLNREDVTDMSDAWHHARKIGRPLNVMVTLRPLDIDDLAPAERRRRIWNGLLNKLGVYARYYQFPWAAVWSFEINPDGTGEHIHVLMHVPACQRAHFDNTVYGWFDDPGAVDVGAAHQMTSFTWHGRRLNAISYISKQMTSQAWYRRGLIRKGGGPILGKRWGCTRNIAWKAREAWWLSQDAAASAAPPKGAKRRAA
jgi:hypothetical protein